MVVVHGDDDDDDDESVEVGWCYRGESREKC